MDPELYEDDPEDRMEKGDTCDAIERAIDGYIDKLLTQAIDQVPPPADLGSTREDSEDTDETNDSGTQDSPQEEEEPDKKNKETTESVHSGDEKQPSPSEATETAAALEEAKAKAAAVAAAEAEFAEKAAAEAKEEANKRNAKSRALKKEVRTHVESQVNETLSAELEEEIRDVAADTEAQIELDKAKAAARAAAEAEAAERVEAQLRAQAEAEVEEEEEEEEEKKPGFTKQELLSYIGEAVDEALTSSMVRVIDEAAEEAAHDEDPVHSLAQSYSKSDFSKEINTVVERHIAEAIDECLAMAVEDLSESDQERSRVIRKESVKRIVEESVDALLVLTLSEELTAQVEATAEVE